MADPGHNGHLLHDEIIQEHKTKTLPDNNQSSTSSHHELTARFPLTELPYDILVKLSLKVPAHDLVHGLAGVDRRLHSVFSDDQYWKDRLRRNWPEFYSACIQGQSELSDTGESAQFWLKRTYRSERIQRRFGKNAIPAAPAEWWALSGVEAAYHEMNDGFGEESTSDFTCVTFCDNGNTLAVADSERGWILFWNLEHDRELPETRLNVFKDLHTSVICSMRSQGHWLTTSAESKIALLDLTQCRTGTASRRLQTQTEVYSHAWVGNLVAAGERDGTLELFDLRRRSSLGVATHFEDICYFDGNEVEMMDNFILSAGWVCNRRTIKLFDIRNRKFVAETTIPDLIMPQPGGHWAANKRFKAATCLDANGHYWLGAEMGMVFEYDSRSLELQRNHSPDLGHTGHISGLHSADGHVMVLSKSGRAGQLPTTHEVSVHAVRKTTDRIWEYKIDPVYGFLPILAFSDAQSSLAVALTDSVILWRSG